MADPDLVDVPVAGGSLRVARWGHGRPVLALHGITATHAAFPYLAAALADSTSAGAPLRLVAPDLRGRGGSRDLPGPFGLAAHADDAAAVIEALGGPVVVVGHSMGAFIAVVLAHRHPGLVSGAVLVDGGLPFAPAELVTTTAGVEAIRRRLETTFAGRAAYRDFFRSHPAFARDWSPEVERYADYDLVAEPGTPSTRVEAMLADQADIEDGTIVREALAGGRAPMAFLHASRGFVDDPPGLYAPGTVEQLRAAYSGLEVTPVPDVNHYTIVMSERGAGAVATAVRRLLTQDPATSPRT
jgi:lipase